MRSATQTLNVHIWVETYNTFTVPCVSATNWNSLYCSCDNIHALALTYMRTPSKTQVDSNSCPVSTPSIVTPTPMFHQQSVLSLISHMDLETAVIEAKSKRKLRLFFAGDQLLSGERFGIDSDFWSPMNVGKRP